MTAALEGGEWSAARPGRTLHTRKDPVPSVLEAERVPGPVWTDGKSRPHRDFFLFICSNTGQYNLSKLSEEHFCIWMLSEIQVNIKTGHWTLLRSWTHHWFGSFVYRRFYVIKHIFVIRFKSINICLGRLGSCRQGLIHLCGASISIWMICVGNPCNRVRSGLYAVEFWRYWRLLPPVIFARCLLGGHI